MGPQAVVSPGKNDSGATSSILSINLLGKFHCILAIMTSSFLSRKTKALLGYLALTEIQEESRERLIGLFWSEVPEERARASLRQALHEIRNALLPTGFNGFHTDKLAVGLNSDANPGRHDRRTQGRGERLAASAAAEAAKPDRRHPERS